MDRLNRILAVFLVFGLCLVGQTIAMADNDDGIGNQSGPGGSKLPQQESPTPVPEPATMILLGSGIAGLLGLGPKLRKK